MPEGDAVRRTARRLDMALAGQSLVRADLRVPRYATTDLSGMTVIGTHVHGKHLLTRLQAQQGAWSLHTHLRMDGRWVTGPAGQRPVAGPAWEIRVWLVGTRQQAVGLRLGIVEVLPTKQESRITDRLGPDILGEAFDARDAASRVTAERARPVVEVLLDQQVISGLGTIWASETAFVAHVSPWTPAGEVLELDQVLAVTRRRMERSTKARSRAEIASYQVYGRKGEACRRCGTMIRAGRVLLPRQVPTDRITYWCPSCQPAPTARPGGSDAASGSLG